MWCFMQPGAHLTRTLKQISPEHKSAGHVRDLAYSHVLSIAGATGLRGAQGCPPCLASTTLQGLPTNWQGALTCWQA